MIENLAADWSLSQMLDELWLRIRRVLIHQLDASHLWIAKVQYQEFLHGQRHLGIRLRDEWLPTVLGQNDFLCLNSERAYRAANARVKAKIPLVLAFGYELGGGFTALSRCESDRCNQAAVLCALFNLGISLFDVIVDQAPELMDTFAGYFDEHTLRRLDTDSNGSAELYVLCNQVEDDELRILLKVIGSFFVELHKLYAGARLQPSAYGILPQLEKAYHSELLSALARTNAVADARRVSEAKSKLPFVVMGQIACLGIDGEEGPGATEIPSLASAVGEVFWLMDDLTDIVDDLRSGSVNALLAECGLTSVASRDRSLVYRIIMDLLSGSHIEKRVTYLVHCLVSLDSRLKSFDVEEKVISHHRQIILSYVRSWIT